MHALIIEDQFLVAALIEDVLRELGYTSFDLVDTEAEAIQAARERCPDLIIADERLSEGSGVKAVRVICADRSIPVVFITEYRTEVHREVPDAVLVGKPFGARALCEAVERSVRSLMAA
jgi:CheY-like chemotaxis protein